MALFGIKNGLKMFNSSAEEADVLNGSVDPSAGAGIAAPQGSLYLMQNGVSYKKLALQILIGNPIVKLKAEVFFGLLLVVLLLQNQVKGIS